MPIRPDNEFTTSEKYLQFLRVALTTLTFNRVLLAVILLGAAMRLFRLGAQSLWLDELFSVLVAQRDLPAVLQGSVQGDTNPPLFNLLLHLVMKLGSEEEIVRSVSLVFSLAALPVFYLFGRDLFQRRTALIAVAILAVNPFHILFAQEARMYAQLTFFVAAAFLFFWRAWCYGRRRYWLLFTAAMTLAFYSHSLAFLNLLALDLFALTQWKKNRSHWLALVLCHVGIGVLFSPWLVVWLGQTANVSAGFWANPATPLALIRTLYLFLFGSAAYPLLLALGLFMTLALVAFIGMALYRALRTKSVTTTNVLFALIIFLVPLLALYLISLVLPIYVERTLIPASLGLYLLLAWLIAQAEPRALHAGIGFVFFAAMLAALSSYYFDPDFQKPQMRQAAQLLRSRFEEGDTVVHTSDSSAQAFMHYAPQLPHNFLAGDPDYVAETTRGRTGRVVGLRPKRMEVTTAGHERVWLVVALDHNVDYQLAQVDAFDAAYKRIDHERAGNIDLLLYETQVGSEE